MSDPTPLRPVDRPVDNGVVELLEELLESARRGDTIAICGVTRNVAGRFGEFTSPSVLNDAVPFLAYTRVLQMRLERQINL